LGLTLGPQATTAAFISTSVALGIRLLASHPPVNNQEVAVALPLWLGAAIAAQLAGGRRRRG
jgi:hypothetical protein